MQVAARSYRAWKSRLPALRTLEDARFTDALRALLVPDGKGRPRPEVIKGRRKTRTTVPGKDGRRAQDLLNRDFHACAWRLEA